MFKQILAAALISIPNVPRVLAHGGVLSIANAGNWYWGWSPYNTPVGQSSVIRPWSSYNPIQDATVTTLACNDDGTSPSTGQQTATVAAGSVVTGYWNVPWPHNTGPMLGYLANCGGSTCTGVNANSLKWFKISEAGLVSGSIYNGTWAAGQMIANNNSWAFTIPKTVPSGAYLLRMETIALHSMPAQFYPECAQLQITGGGSLQPTAAQLVTFPGAYSNNDPGLNIDIYSNQAQVTFNYTIPGPPLYGSSASSTTAVASSSASAPVGTSSAPTTSATGTTGTTGATAAEYAQCGGIGWTGATVCATPYKCTVVNSYYSQCL